jgi:hypothetical protein
VTDNADGVFVGSVMFDGDRSDDDDDDGPFVSDDAIPLVDTESILVFNAGDCARDEDKSLLSFGGEIVDLVESLDFCGACFNFKVSAYDRGPL